MLNRVFPPIQRRLWKLLLVRIAASSPANMTLPGSTAQIGREHQRASSMGHLPPTRFSVTQSNHPNCTISIELSQPTVSINWSFSINTSNLKWCLCPLQWLVIQFHVGRPGSPLLYLSEFRAAFLANGALYNSPSARITESGPAARLGSGWSDATLMASANRRKHVPLNALKQYYSLILCQDHELDGTTRQRFDCNLPC
jgi:hypothetical protein